MENRDLTPLIKALEELFSYVTPAELKESIYEIFSSHLQTIDENTDFECFRKWSENVYFLHKFLDKVEEEFKDGGF